METRTIYKIMAVENRFKELLKGRSLAIYFLIDS